MSKAHAIEDLHGRLKTNVESIQQLNQQVRITLEKEKKISLRSLHKQRTLQFSQSIFFVDYYSLYNFFYYLTLPYPYLTNTFHLKVYSYLDSLTR